MNIGERIRARRNELGLSLQKVADLSDVSKAHIYEVEIGRCDNPGIKLLMRLSQVLDVDFYYFFGLGKVTANPTDNAFCQKYLSLPNNAKDRVRRVVREMLR